LLLDLRFREALHFIAIIDRSSSMGEAACAPPRVESGFIRFEELLVRPLPLCAILLLAAGSASAQITLFNQGSSVTNPFAQTIGTQISVDAVNFMVGTGSLLRNTSPANSSYLPTAWATNSGGTGFTLQFWIKRATATTGNADYIFGDNTMIAPTTAGASGGAFRCFIGGIAGASKMIIRGVSNQMITAGLPFATPGTWVHVALVHTPAAGATAGNLAWYINGVLDISMPQTTVVGGVTWAGTNLSICGYNGSTASSPQFNMDEIRVYSFPRTVGDIAADMNSAATGTGPSGASNIPDKVYFNCDGSVQPHICQVGTNGDGLSTGQRIMTNNTPIEWAGTSSTIMTGVPASCLINIHGPGLGLPATNPYVNSLRLPAPMTASYMTPGLAGLQLGHGYSWPLYPAAVIWPDALGLGALPGLALLSMPIPYQYNVSPNNGFTIPAGLFQDGDVIDMQFLAPDPAYPASLGISNRGSFVFSNPSVVNPGAHLHIEARGNGAIQVSTFWEIWNTGVDDILSVTIDASTCVANGGTATGFFPAGALNTGGTLAAGTSYRLNSNAYCGLDTSVNPMGYAPVGTALATPVGAYPGISFNFSSFQAGVDVFLFDCDSAATQNTTGNAYIGATVTVTFASNPTTPVTGLLMADPAAGNAAILDI
jgi:hypothetical protein